MFEEICRYKKIWRKAFHGIDRDDLNERMVKRWSKACFNGRQHGVQLCRAI